TISPLRCAARRGLRKELDRALEREPDTPGERNSDGRPCEHGAPVEAAFSYAVGSAHDRRGGRALPQLRYLFIAHVPLRVDGPNERIADQAHDEKTAEDVERIVVDAIGRNARLELAFADEGDEGRTDDAGDRPRG